MRKERCWSLGKKFQCIPESSTNIRWYNNNWEYKLSPNHDWKIAPIIGKSPNKYIYPITFKHPTTRTLFKKSISFGFLFLLIGIIGLYYNDKKELFIENLHASISAWVMSFIFILLISYISIFLAYRIWNWKKY